MGFPFIGPAGKIFDDVLKEAMDKVDAHELSWGVMNIVACMPNISDTADVETRAPTKEEASTCESRTVQLIQLSKPKLIVTLGDIPSRFLPRHRLPDEAQLPVLPLIHPARMFHMSDHVFGIQFRKQVIALSRALEELL